MDKEKYAMYSIACRNALRKLKKLVYSKGVDCAAPAMNDWIANGIRAIAAKPEPDDVTPEQAKYDYTFISVILDSVRILTPREFEELFPLEDGSDMVFLYPDDSIGDDVLDFLWKYDNKEVIAFNFKMMRYLNNLRKLNGQPSLLEEWKNAGITNQDKRKATNSKKARPEYLKVVKGEE